MKTPFKSLLLLAAGLPLLGMSAGANAMAYDSLGADMHGGSPRELQAFTATVESADPSVCGAGCLTNFGYDGINNYVMAYDNLTPAAGSTGAATFPQAEDHYVGTCATGTEPCAGAPFYLVYDAFLPHLIGAAPTQYDLAPGSTIRRWDFTTGPNGKIIDGWIVHESLFGSVFTTFVDFTNSAFCSMSGGTAVDVNVSSIRTSGCNPTGTAPLTWDATHNFAYVTCDITSECGQLSKSVPVPAFAAAALAIGLVGVTALTRRRR